MHRKLLILEALSPVVYHREDHKEKRAEEKEKMKQERERQEATKEKFDLIKDTLFQRFEDEGIFKKLLPVLDKIDNHEYTNMDEMNALFKSVQEYHVLMYQIIKEAKSNLEDQEEEVKMEADLEALSSRDLILKVTSPLK